MTVTLVEYDTEQSPPGPYPAEDATGRSWWEKYDPDKESLPDLKNRLKAQVEEDDSFRVVALETQAAVNTWLTSHDLL